MAAPAPLPEGAVLIALTYLPRFANDYVKQLVSEPRPYRSLVYVGFPHDNLSFPLVMSSASRWCSFWRLRFAAMSGSTLVVAAIRGLVSVRRGVGLARIWLGAHWPTDALGGYIYAALFLIPALLWLRARDSKQAPSRS